MAISHCYWHCYWNFNHEGSYLPGVICNIAVKAHFGKSSLQMKCSTWSDIHPLGTPQCPLMLPMPLLLPGYLESLLAPQYTPYTPWHPPNGHPTGSPGGETCLIERRQVTQMSYAALYKHVALFAVTIYKYVHTSPNHIFLHEIYKNAMRTISTPDQFTHILPSTI